jgi:hypothetical protein
MDLKCPLLLITTVKIQKFEELYLRIDFSVGMGYKHTFRQTIISTFFLLSATFAQAQVKGDWYNTGTGKYQVLPAGDIKTSSNRFTLKISFTNYILEISPSKDNQLAGHLIVFTSSYQEGDYNGRFSQNYFTEHTVSSDTARMVYDLFTREGIERIPTDKDIAGWSYGFDGITYNVETTINGNYSKKTYWTPSAFKEIKEAVILDHFFSNIKSTLQLQAKWDSFLSNLPRGKAYRYGSMMVVRVADYPATEVQRIVLTYKKFDEPPVVGGRPEYTIIFNLDNTQLITASYSVGKDRVTLEDTLSYSSSLVKTITEWAKDKQIFSLNDLGLTRGRIEDTIVFKKNELVLPMPDDLVVNLDSLSICKAHLMKQVVSIGGGHVRVSIIYNNHEEKFEFDDDNLYTSFDLKGYIICYAIFNDILPEEFPAYNFFSEQILVDLHNQYQKIVECEGYYYKEYTSKHPELSARDRRMMKGWDFKKYLKETGRTK